MDPSRVLSMFKSNVNFIINLLLKIRELPGLPITTANKYKRSATEIKGFSSLRMVYIQK